MRWWIGLLAMSGCMSIDDAPTPWQPASTIDGPLTVELGPSPVGVPPAPQVLRIVSWNVFKGKHPEELARTIANSKALASADVILIQEIESYGDEPGSRASRLATALGMTWVYAPARIEGSGTHGDAILSRFPLLDPVVKRLPHVDQPTGARPRIALRATVDLGGGATLPVVGVHLDTRLGPVDRIRQLSPAVVDNPPTVVVGGDFNTIPFAWIDTLVPLTSTEAIVGQSQAIVLDDYFNDLGFETPLPADTDTHDFPVDMRLDALYPRGVSSRGTGIDADSGGSDHFPVWLDVAP